MLINTGSNHPIGLDISDLSLKLLQLHKNGDKTTIQAAGKIDLPKGIIEAGEIKNRAEVIKAINSLVDHPAFGKITTNEVVACLPESKTFVKLIEIEKNPNDLTEVIKAEVEKHIPLSLDEIYFDWQIVKTLPDKILVLIAAAAKSIVDDYTNLLDEAGLSVAALEIESIAICRALLAEENYKFKGEGTGNYAIIDIGAIRTSMIVYSQNTILFTVSMPISGEKITKNIADSLQIDINQAEKAKIICGLDEDKAEGVVKSILEDMLKDLTSRIKEAIKFYDYHFSNRGQLSKIILCGGGANISNIDTSIKKSVGIEVALADTSINLEIGNDELVETIVPNSAYPYANNNTNKHDITVRKKGSHLSYATAIGLALRGLFIDEL